MPQAAGFLYGILALLIIAVLWKTKRMSRKTGYLFLVISALSGFILFAPVAPYQFQTIFIRNLSSNSATVFVVISGLVLIFALSFAFGRIFCGNICPVGVLQEIVSLLPVKKRGKYLKKYSVAIRAFVFLVILVSGLLFSVSVLGILGVRDFFYLDIASASFFVFALILLISVFVYRPFCRFLCPYGVFLAVAASRSVCKFRRTDKCIECGKCEKVCPVNEAGVFDSKSECYMCGRCTEVCPVDGALVYSGAFSRTGGSKKAENE
ncbi:polyferredoxin [Methanomicrobium sp. W14]|uniref:4Fe-4S binding protein n=1 Tax=Methanomicrobium sp. W14 TaxID=2817839 RepID=UPI001FDA7221|nr:4Fe-4S binding protein [Methanomicrobium sp. W14]MBP2133654.1 polyferredoxin [Methanomicrobium sp. W14]